MDRKRYPKHWKRIRDAIVKRANNHCEQCGVENGRWIVRSLENGADWRYFALDEICYYAQDGTPIHVDEVPEAILANPQTTKVVLTVHHIGVAKEDGSPGDPHDKMDCRPQNLICLCQRCHFEADRPENVKASKVTRLNKRRKATKARGQSELFQE